MKAYIVTETDIQDNLVLRSWVCLTVADAITQLRKRYNFARSTNLWAGEPEPVDNIDYGFFYWREMGVKYNLRETTLCTD